MREVELNMLVQTDSMYEKAASALSEKYNGAWEDEVHNSFRLLLNQIDENHSMIHSGTAEADEIYQMALGLDVEGLCQTADSLCREVEAL